MILAISLCSPVYAEDLPAKRGPVGDSATPFIVRQIKPGDTIKVNVWKYSDLNANLIVGPEGCISYSYLGEIPVAGKTVEEVRLIITKKLDQQYVANPKVDIQLETQPPVIFVIGEVARPGSYGYQLGLDPLKAVALAGGFTDFASRDALIIRKDATGKDAQIKVDLNKLMKATPDRDKYSLQSGDMVVIKKSWF